MPTTYNHATSNGNWTTTGIWSRGVVPTSTDFAYVDAGITVNVATAVTTEMTHDLTIDGILAVLTGCSFNCSSPSSLTVSAGGTLATAGALTIGTFGTIAGTLDFGATYPVTTFSAGKALIVSHGATIKNYIPYNSGGWGVNFGAGAGCYFDRSHWGCTVTYVNSIDGMPNSVKVLSVSPWTTVAIDGKLGNIEFLMEASDGTIDDSLQLPAVFVYKNGAIWDGPVSVQWSPQGNFGQFFVDVDFTTSGATAGAWALGDHGSIKAMWNRGGNWYAREYYWLADKLAYQTWQRVTTALPDVAPGVAGGVSLLGSKMDLIDAPNVTAITAIQNGLSKPGTAQMIVSNSDITAIKSQADKMLFDSNSHIAAYGIGGPSIQSTETVLISN